MRIRNRVQWVLEFIIIFVLVVGGISLFFAEPVSGSGPVARVIGSQYAVYFYATLFTLEGLALAWSKAFKHKRSRKHILFVIYLTMLFTILLQVLLSGLTWDVIDNIIASLASGWCWLHWKMRTEYLDPAIFEKDVDGLREDSPPSRQYKFKKG